jgi:hypothetical protein
MKHHGYKSPNAVQQMIAALAKKGRVKKGQRGYARTVTVIKPLVFRACQQAGSGVKKKPAS